MDGRAEIMYKWADGNGIVVALDCKNSDAYSAKFNSPFIFMFPRHFSQGDHVSQ